MVKLTEGYSGNKNLKKIGEKIAFTQNNIDEYRRCSIDPIYFLETYGKIVSLDDGIVPFKLFPYQKRIILALKNNSKVLAKLFRQSGKSTVVAGYIAWYVLFSQNKRAAILANKMATAKEIFSRVQFIISSCPKWLQQGVDFWNKTSLKLENGSSAFCAATSADAIRGDSISFILLDEFAFLRSELAEEFIASVFPTMSSAESAKMVIVSTPKGMNHYYKLWKEAEDGINGFFPISADWKEHPKRTQAWADEQRKLLGEIRYNQEIGCSFIGSAFTLISGEKLSSLPTKQPVYLTENLKQFYAPDQNHSYVILVDTARGLENDNSAFVVIDISVYPYKVVCTFKNNSISTLVYPELLYRTGMKYNKAFIFIETNDLGQQVADTLVYDLEYENVYMSNREDLKEGGGNGVMPGCRTTKRTKQIGCDQIKSIIENDGLEVNDSDIIYELTTFVRDRNTYKADSGKHDDLAMCLVFFGFLTSQPVFKELFDFSLREKFFENQLRNLEEQMLPIGFYSDGTEDIVHEPKSFYNGFWQENTTDDFNW